MATLYQLYSSMDKLRRSANEIGKTWRAGDSIILLGSTAAFIDWFNAYINETDIEGISNIYALAADVAGLGDKAIAQLKLESKISALLSDSEWVKLTQDAQFDKVVTIAL